MEEFAVGAQANLDALGVIETVHAQQDAGRVPEGLSDLGSPLDRRWLLGQISEAGAVNPNREGAEGDVAFENPS